MPECAFLGLSCMVPIDNPFLVDSSFGVDISKTLSLQL